MIKNSFKIFVILLCFISECIAADSYEQKPPFKIAAIFAQTGAAKENVKACIETAKLTVQYLNKNRSIAGREIQLVVIDNKSTPIGSKLAAQKAVELGVDAVIGAGWSSHSLPMAKILQDAGILMITPLSSSPQITRAGDYIFRVCFDDSFQGKILADFACQNLKAKTAVILEDMDEEYSIALSRVFQENFSKYTNNKPIIESYRNISVDFSDILSKIKKISPDIIFIPGYERESRLIIKQARDMGIDKIFIGGDGWLGSSFDKTNYTSKAMEGSYCSVQWHPKMRPLPSALKEILTQKSSDPTKLTDVDAVHLTYDAVMILAEAVSRAGSTEKSEIRDALAATKDFKGAAGDITFNQLGEPINKKAAILKFENGTWNFVKSMGILKIASIYAQSGIAAEHNASSVLGVRISIDEINSKGGLLGNMVDLIEIDNKSTPIGSKDAAVKAAEENVSGIIGAAWSSHSLEAGKIAQKNRIPMITNVSTNPDVTKDRDAVFRVCFTDTFQGQVLAIFAKKELKAKKAVIFSDITSYYSMGLAEEFEKNFTKLKGQILLKLSYRPNRENFSDLAEKAKEADPDIIFIPGHDESGNIIKNLLKNDVNKVIIGGDGWNTEKFFLNGGNMLQQGYYCTHWTREVETKTSKDFLKKYDKKFNITDKLSLAYDAAMLLFDAITRAGSADNEKIIEALKNTKNFKGVTGTISLNSDGDPVKGAVIMKITDGKSAYFKTIMGL